MLTERETPSDGHPGSLVDTIFDAAVSTRGFLSGADIRLLAHLYQVGRVSDTDLKLTGGRPLWLIVTTAASILSEDYEKVCDD